MYVALLNQSVPGVEDILKMRFWIFKEIEGVDFPELSL